MTLIVAASLSKAAIVITAVISRTIRKVMGGVPMLLE